MEIIGWCLIAAPFIALFTWAGYECGPAVGLLWAGIFVRILACGIGGAILTGAYGQ